jgi:hypothetical protein
VLEVCGRVADMRAFADARDRGTAVGDRGELVVASDGDVAALKQCLTHLEPFAHRLTPARSSHSGNDNHSGGGGGKNGSGGGGSASKAASAVGGKPMWTRGALMLVAESREAAATAARGFELALHHHRHHAIDPATGRPRHAPLLPGAAVNGHDEEGANGSGGSGGAAKRGGGSSSSHGYSSGRGGVLDVGSATKMGKHGGGFSKALQALHHLYRPHHHANHPLSRFHLGVACEVAYHATAYKLTCEVSRAKSSSSSSTHGSGGSRISSLGGVAGSRKSNGVGGRTVKPIALPCPVFRPYMYLRAIVKAYDAAKDTYDLEYV